MNLKLMCCGDMFCIIKEQYKPAILIYMKKSMWGKIIKMRHLIDLRYLTYIMKMK